MASSKTDDEKTAPAKRSVSKPTRKEQLRKLLERKSGATLAQLQETFGCPRFFGVG